VKLRGRPIAPGRATGTALVSPAPFSFVGGADPTTGEVLDPRAGLGERLSRRIFAFPHGKGSTVGSYVIYGLAKRGTGPAAIVNSAAEGIIAVGATLAGIPLVDRVDIGGLRTGDRLIVDGNRGTLDLPDVRGAQVVTAVLRNKDRILIVRRSKKVGSFRGRWSAVSGYLEGHEEPKARAVREIREETGIRKAIFRAASSPVLARDDATLYVVHPFLFDVPSRRVRLDWENVEHRWIRPSELDPYHTVPRLKDVVAAVLSRPHKELLTRSRPARRPSPR
jgi:phosphomecalonate degydratase small subunit